MKSALTGKTGIHPAHAHVHPRPMPRAPGLHAPAVPTRTLLQSVDPESGFGAVKKKHGAKARPADLPVATSTAQGQYLGAELRALTRPGADDALALPSRMGNRLHYRDGQVTDMQGNPNPNNP